VLCVLGSASFSFPNRTGCRVEHGFPHWFQSPGKVFDTKLTTKFWVIKRKVRIQFKQKFSKQIADDSDAVKGSTQQREGTRKGPVMMKQTQRGGPQPSPFWPAPFGRSPEDAASAARARSGALGSKASGGTLRGRTGWGSRGQTPPI